MKDSYVQPMVELESMPVERGFEGTNTGIEGTAPDSDDSEFGN